MVAVSYILSALSALSAVQASAQGDAIKQTSNDASAVSNDLSGLSQQLHSGAQVSNLNLGSIVSDVEKFIGDVTKFPSPSNIKNDISDVESILKEAIGTFKGLGNNFHLFLNDAGTQNFAGSSDGVVSGIAGALKGLESKIAGALGFVPKEIQNLISDFLGIIEKIPFP